MFKFQVRSVGGSLFPYYYLYKDKLDGKFYWSNCDFKSFLFDSYSEAEKERDNLISNMEHPPITYIVRIDEKTQELYSKLKAALV